MIKTYSCMVLALLVGTGCAENRSRIASSQEAGKVAAASSIAQPLSPKQSPRTEQLFGYPSESHLNPPEPAFQLASDIAPVQHDEQDKSLPEPEHHPTPGHAQSKPGHEYVPPPEIPPAPEQLEQFGAEVQSSNTPLTLDALESLAQQNNPTLMQAQAHVQGALGEALEAGLWPNPTLSYVGEQIGAEGTAGEFQGGTVRQRIVTGQKLQLSREKYLARTRVAEWNALAQQYRVLNDVRAHYFRARGMQELLAIRRELLKNAEDLVVTRREQFNLGQATQAEVHLANVQLERQRLEVLMTENDYRRAYEELTAMVGIELVPQPLETPLTGDLKPLDWNTTLARLMTESPQLMAARQKLAADQITVQRELVQPIPDIVVQGGVGRNFEADQTTASAMISLDVPIFDRNQGTIRQAEADLARQQGEIRRIELLLRRELARQYGDYLTALQHVRNYQESILPEARRAYELQLESYKANRIAWPVVLNTQEQYFSLRAEYIRQLVAWREADVILHGYLLHDGLQAPTNPVPPGHIDSVPRPR